MLARKQRTYAIVDAGDDDGNGVGGNIDCSSSVADAPDTRKSHTHKKRFRKKIESQEDEDYARGAAADRQVKRRTSGDEDNISESQEERLRDQREREQLEQNIRERDRRYAAGTRKLTEPKLSRREKEEAMRRSVAVEQNGLETLRKVSRQEYLKKREKKKLEELRDDIEDEQYLLDGVKLNEAEYHELWYKKEIYELVKKRSEYADDSTSEYRMPEAYDQEGGVNQEKRFSVVLQRYRPDPTAAEKTNPFAEQEAWEEHQIGKATSSTFASKNKKQISDHDYQFVFEIRLILSKHQLWREKHYLYIHIGMNCSKLFMIIRFLSSLVKLVPERLHRYPSIFMQLDIQSAERLDVHSHEGSLL